MSLTNDELEQQLLQLADALAKMSEMTATAFEDRDKHIQALREKVEALESKMKSDDLTPCRSLKFRLARSAQNYRLYS